MYHAQSKSIRANNSMYAFTTRSNDVAVEVPLCLSDILQWEAGL